MSTSLLKNFFHKGLTPPAKRAGFILLNTRKANLTGFTLIELIVGISIVAIISSVSVLSYRNASSGTVLQLEVHKLIADIRRVQTMALGGVNFAGSATQGGWGINILDATHYVIFADVNNDGVYDAGDGNCPGTGECLKKITLANGITFTAGVTDEFTYTPPDPTTFINSVNAGTLAITLSDTNNSRTITINFLGLVDINEES